MAQDGGIRGRIFMAKWIAAEKVRAGLSIRHALLVVVCSNVTGRINERIAQSKRACASSLAIVDSPQAAQNLYPRGVFLVCTCRVVFLWR